MTTIRSCAGICRTKAFVIVVLPVDVPPDTKMFLRSRTAIRMSFRTWRRARVSQCDGGKLSIWSQRRHGWRYTRTIRKPGVDQA